MAHTIQSMALMGIQGISVEVEVDLLRRLPSMVIVGLAGSAVRESADRVRSAIQAAGRVFPRARVVVNLAPAGLRKSGPAFDLPIAIAILIASEQLDPTRAADTVFVGELSLEGVLRPVRGALALAMAAVEHGAERIILPKHSAADAAVVEDIEVLAAPDLSAVLDWMIGVGSLPRAVAPQPDIQQHAVDLKEVRGQHRPRRAMEVAAAGGHNLLMMGSPGCGKTMLAARMPTILPDLTPKEAIEITRVYSVAGLLEAGSGLVAHRPFRAPHHSITVAGLMGNAQLLPGEVSLAHHGVLFLDEIAEFRRDALEVLRSPLENRFVQLSRAAGTARYPASFSMVAAANPCPCGYHGHPTRVCTCPPHRVEWYRNRLSGPLIDRIDLQVWVQPVDPDALIRSPGGESSAAVRARVETARQQQRERAIDEGVSSNAALSGDAIRRVANPTSKALTLLEETLTTHGLSGRAWARILKVARTLADLEGEERVHRNHILEASSYRLDLEAA